jgi:PIN domain nuclease of toxin-antitoxin system
VNILLDTHSESGRIWRRHWSTRRINSGFQQVALQSRLIELPDKDPADRLIAATALVQGLTRATADQHLLKCRSIRTTLNR